ncbi:MAG: glucose-6-phosphate isomerase [Sedimentisphaerales bacterium]|nr:glucose-6-phosphate isomerase [Sedimentisphaerales bacterium]
MSDIKLYYRNVLSCVIGKEHGISPRQLRSLGTKTRPIIRTIQSLREKGLERYRELPYDRSNPRKVKALVKRLRPLCDDLVVLGIGGSALGNIALQTALNPYLYNLDPAQRDGPRLFILDNIDPVQFVSFLDWIEPRLDRTIFNVISKSGRTSETAAQMLIIWDMLTKRLGPGQLKEHVVATTDPRTGTLRCIVEQEGLMCLEVPEGVGGRFSVLSPVGLFSAAMCGIDIDRLLAGARAMDKRVSSEEFLQNPAAIIAAINWHYYQQGKTISVMMPYSYQLKDMADWYRQLWAESLGKARDTKGRLVHVGPTPVKALGATDQHSQIQLYREGPNNKLFTFLYAQRYPRDVRIGPSLQSAPELDFLAGRTLGQLLDAERKATQYALIVDQRPCLDVIFDKIDAYSVGQFIYLYEVATSIAGRLFGIDPYDQPAVELGKDATYALMGRPGYEQLLGQMQQVMGLDQGFLV